MKLVCYMLPIVFLFSCNPGENTSSVIKLNAEEIIEARTLFQTHCFACHTPDGEQGKRIAPPMIAIKRHYITENTSQEEFIQDVLNFVPSPSEKRSKMPGAVRNFGLMFPLPVPEEDLRKIATYIYQQDIKAPDWFEDHFKEEHQ